MQKISRDSRPRISTQNVINKNVINKNVMGTINPNKYIKKITLTFISQSSFSIRHIGQ